MEPTGSLQVINSWRAMRGRIELRVVVFH